MPKKIERPKDKYKHFVISKIEYECDKRDIDNKHQQIIARASESKYNRKRRDPGKFTLDELTWFADGLKIPVWELLNPNIK